MKENNERFFKEKLLLAIVDAITQKFERTNKELQEKLYKHYITNLYNRFFLTKNGRKLLNKYNTLLVIDIRHIKRFNEIFGYQTVDKLLKHLAEALKTFCEERKCLAGSLDLARFWVLVNVKNKKEAEQLAKEIIILLTERNFQKNGLGFFNLLISVNIGIAFVNNSVKNIEELLRYAEIAAEKAKEIEINTYAFFDEAFKQELETNVRIEQLLRDSLNRGTLQEEVYPVFQIKVNPKTEKPTGAEVLMRWKRFQGPIFKVIQVAEQTGMIKDLTTALAFNSLPTIVETLREYPHFKFSYNLSPVLFKFWEIFKDQHVEFKKFNIPTSVIEFEITETALMTVKDATEYVKLLKEKGFGILIDDFGKGYSAFDRLMEIDFDGVKLDKSLMNKLTMEILKGTYHSKVGKFIKGLVEFAKSQDYKITAEGVEQKETIDLLKEWDIDEIQGYYYAKPVVAERFLECLRNWGNLKRCYPEGE